MYNAIKVSFQKEKGCVIFEDICYAIRSKQKQSNVKKSVQNHGRKQSKGLNRKFIS